MLRRLAFWAFGLLVLAYCVQGPIAYTLIKTFKEEEVNPTFWGYISFTAENRTPQPIILEEVLVGDMLAFYRPKLLQPTGNLSSGHAGGVARPPGSHRVRIATRPERDGSVFERWFDLKVEAGYERHCVIAVYEAEVDVTACERVGRTDRHGDPD